MSESDSVLKVSSPLSGWCASLEDSPDPVFRGRMLGDGVSIDPTAGELRAPFDAEVVTVPESRHAVNLRADNGAEFLIHVGIDTVDMGGDGFEAHVQAGDRVECGQLLLSFDLEKLLRAATSLRTPVLLLQSDAWSVKRSHADGMVKAGEPLFEVHGVSPDHAEAAVSEPAQSQVSGTVHSQSLVTGLEHGIHARPAAGLIEAIKDLDARVSLEHEGHSANLLSAVALMSLNTRRGSRLTISASGPDAQRALKAVVEKLEPLDEHETVDLPPVSDSISSQCARLDPPEPGSVVRALPASPGLGCGQAFLLDTFEVDETLLAGTREEERDLLHAAVEKVRSHLELQASEGEDTGAGIARAHLALLADPLVVDQAEQYLDKGQAAAACWQKAVDEAIVTLSRVDDPRMRERVDDLRDINLRVQRALAGEDPEQGLLIPQGAVVVAENLLPSQLLEMDRKRLSAICLAAGGATSHVAILAISLQVPMLVAAGENVLGIEAGSELLIDAELGELHIGPSREAAVQFTARMDKDRQKRDEEAKGASEPCTSRDGVRIHFNANIGSAADAKTAVESGAEGCGLLRTEFVFMERSQAPGVDQQVQIYSEISQALGDRPLVIRTLDAGGDKPIAYLAQDREENPALGVRGIRLCLSRPELLESQLLALVKTAHLQPIQVMIPMISSVSEVEEVRSVLSRVAGKDAASCIKLGVMIETPAAALIADRLAEVVDFFSIGTNDLAQYTLCMDRGEPALANRLDALHPAVLALIRQTVRAADKADIPVAVCGGAAGDLLAAPLLLGLGIRELSMPASLIARQKANLREVSVSQCEKLAARALQMRSAREVRRMMRDFLMA